MKLYAMSDLHGCYDELLIAMQNVELENTDNVLVFCGDYVDGNADSNSMKLLYYLYDLQKKYGNRVVVLRGNHDQWFLEYIEKGVGQYGYPSIETLQDMVGEEEFYTIITYARRMSKTNPDVLFYVNQECRKVIIKKHKKIIDWMKIWPLYFENENQIYVHAGIEEIECDNDSWKKYTDEHTFLMKHIFDGDYFYKDIIAGHSSSALVANDKSYLGQIYKLGPSHYFIDGNTMVSKRIPVLVYDTEINEYEFK